MATTRKIVGLSGLAGSGKDTAATFLIERKWHPIAFADPVRKGLYELNPVVSVDYGHAPIPENLKSTYIRLKFLVDSIGWDEAKKHTEVRHLLQRFGTESGRDIHGDECWIKLFKKSMRGYRQVVATDVRFPNEANFIHKHNGILLRISRPNTPQMTHRSEQPQKLQGAVDITNVTLEQLERDVLHSVASHFGEV